MRKQRGYTMKRLLLAGAVVFLGIAVAAPEMLFTPWAYLELRNCESVKPGMSEQQVLAIIGPPQSRTVMADGSVELASRELLLASTAPVIHLSLKDGKHVVADPVCADLG